MGGETVSFENVESNGEKEKKSADAANLLASVRVEGAAQLQR